MRRANTSLAARATFYSQRTYLSVGCFALVSYLLLFLGMSRTVNIYDEGLTLTAIMRVLAGQIPHRDFYANYGPAEFYSYAVFFKLFGQSVLVGRLVAIGGEALTVALIYFIVSRYCRPVVAIATAPIFLLWCVGIRANNPTPIIPVALLNLSASMLILPAFRRQISWRRCCLAGGVAGLSGLYRYDTGIALLAVQVCLLAAASLRRSTERPLRQCADTIWPYIVGFFAVVLPPAIYFAAVSPIHPLVHDIILYPSRYYVRARKLPFPGIKLHYLDQLVVYLPVLILALSFYLLVAQRLDRRTSLENDGDLDANMSRVQRGDWKALLLVMSVLSFAMFFKGYVRVGPAQMYLSIVPATVVGAVVFDKRALLPSPLRRFVVFIAVAGAALSIVAFGKTVKADIQEGSVPGRIVQALFFPDGSSSQMDAVWCKTSNPVTRGFCFRPDDANVRVIEFISTHTRPGQTLFVGLDRHDRTYENDNLIYFATQRLPATKWSHFDPDLQNTAEIQSEMTGELEKSRPPYLVLDSEFDNVNEPNDSSRSSGVTLLDTFIRQNYEQKYVFGELSIWQRTAQ